MKHTKIQLVKLAAYYEKVLSPEQIELYAGQLFEHLTNEQLSAACKLYIDNPKNEFFPRPVSKLIELIKKPIDDVDYSVAVAGRVVQAISQFGWSNEKAALEFIGEKGREAVKRFGGWLYVCENLGREISLTTFQAQCRDGVKADLKIVRHQETFAQLENNGSVIKMLNLTTKELK